MKEFDVFVPLDDNNGSPIHPRRFRDLQVRLLEYFNGVTFFPQENEGYWRMGSVTYRDRIVIYRVVTSKVRAARRFFKVLKEELKRSFRQEDIFIVERDVKVI
jgi:hypothetical protein